MGPIERNELLERAERLMSQRNFAELAKLLESNTPSLGTETPQLLFFLALAWSHIGKQQNALELTHQLLEDLRRGSRDRLLLRALNLEGALLMESGALSEASERFEEVISYGSAAHDPRFIAAATMNLATLHAMRHRWESAIVELHHAIGISRSAGLRHQVGGCHHNMGMIFRELRCFAESSQHFGEARRILKIWGTRAEQIATDYESALMIALAGDFRFGLARAVNALALSQELTDRRFEGEALRVIGIIKHLIGDRIASKACLEQANRIAIELDLTPLRAETTECLAIVLECLTLVDEAKDLATQAANLYQTIGIPPGLGARWMKSANPDCSQIAS
jgi:tetratricopeptide (TPR) repeat protein